MKSSCGIKIVKRVQETPYSIYRANGIDIRYIMTKHETW